MPVNAATEYTDGYYTYRFTDDDELMTYHEVEIIKVVPELSGDVIVPSMLGGYPVRFIGDGALYNCENITSIVIPEGVWEIGSSAFSERFNLQTVTLPHSIYKIGYGAFSTTPYSEYVYYMGTFGDWYYGVEVLRPNEMLDHALMFEYESYPQSDLVKFQTKADFGKTAEGEEVLRFYFTPTYKSETKVTKFGALIVPYALFSISNLEAMFSTVNKSIKSGKTYSWDLKNIPESAYDSDVVAIPYVYANGGYVYGVPKNVSVNNLK